MVKLTKCKRIVKNFYLGVLNNNKESLTIVQRIVRI